MASLQIQRIICGREGAADRLAALRTLLGAQGNVVSSRGRTLTEKVFGEALSPLRVVERVCEDVRKRGRDALFHYTEQFDKVSLDADTLRVTLSEMALAHASADPAFLDAVRRIRQNILAFQTGIVHRSAVLTVAGKHELRLQLSAAASRRHHDPRRGGGVSVHAVDDGLSGAGGGRAGVGRRHAADGERGLQPRPAGRLP